MPTAILRSDLKIDRGELVIRLESQMALDSLQPFSKSQPLPLEHFLGGSHTFL